MQNPSKSFKIIQNQSKSCNILQIQSKSFNIIQNPSKSVKIHQNHSKSSIPLCHSVPPLVVAPPPETGWVARIPPLPPSSGSAASSCAPRASGSSIISHGQKHRGRSLDIIAPSRGSGPGFLGGIWFQTPNDRVGKF